MDKRFLYILIFTALLTSYGCSSNKTSSSFIDKITRKPGVYIENLKHPTDFPEEFLPTVLNIDDFLAKNPLKDGEDAKMLLFGTSKLTSTHFVQVRKDAELKLHFHKKHDKNISVKKGKGIAILNGIRYLVKPGSALQVPAGTKYKFINSGDDIFLALSVFTPPFNGEDITFVKELVEDRPASEAQKEKRKIEKQGGRSLPQNKENSDPAKSIKKVREKARQQKAISVKRLHDAKSSPKPYKEDSDFLDSFTDQNLLNERPADSYNKQAKLRSHEPKSADRDFFTETKNESEQESEYDFDLDKKMDSGKRIDEYMDNNNTSIEEVDTLQYGNNRKFEQLNESKLIYESGSVFEYVEDDEPFAPASEPFIREEHVEEDDEYEEFDEF